MNPEIVTMFFEMCIIGVVGGMVCGDEDNCICRGGEVTCRGLPRVEYVWRLGKTLIWDMDSEDLDGSINYDELLRGYDHVEIRNAPRDVCEVKVLRAYVEECGVDGEDITDGDFTERVMTTETVMKGKIGGDGLVTADLSVTEKGIVIAIAINTAKISLVGYLLYQVMVSLVFIHARLNQLEGRETSPQCVVGCTHSWMTCCYACMRRVFCCCRRHFKVPDFHGKSSF